MSDLGCAKCSFVFRLIFCSMRFCSFLMVSCWRRRVTDVVRPELDSSSSDLEGAEVVLALLFGCGLWLRHGYPLCTTDETVGD